MTRLGAAIPRGDVTRSSAAPTSVDGTTDGAPLPTIGTRNLFAGYGQVPVIEDLTVSVHPGELVALLGPNGAGKSTTLLTLAGEIKPMSGQVLWKGEVVTESLFRRARRGLRLVTEERSVFMNLTTAENLRLGRREQARYLESFPELTPLLKRKVALLSGGEQQILALSRALGDDPELLLADELSLGLAPKVVTRLLTATREAADNGAAVVIVEQHVARALEIADRAYFLRRGRIVLQGPAREFLGRAGDIEEAYLSGGSQPSGLR